MFFCKEMAEALAKAKKYALSHGYEFITPELILLILASLPTLCEAFEDCDGNIVMLQKDLRDYLEEYVNRSTEEPELSYGADFLLDSAAKSAFNSPEKKICVRHLVNAFWELENSYATYFIEKQDIDRLTLLKTVQFWEEAFADEDDALNGNELFIHEDGVSEDEFLIDEPSIEPLPLGPDSEDSPNEKASTEIPCLNEALKDVNPLIGREDELDRTIQILCRKDKNNPLHIGEPGVGKTAITHGLVKLIQKNNVPTPLQGAKVFAMDMGNLLAGTQYRGDFEKKLKRFLERVSKEEKPIIYIDEIHTLCGAGAIGDGALDASNILKPYLADGHIRFIGATTFEEYKKYFEKNKSLVRRFQNVEIKEPTEDEAVKILQGLVRHYEKFHGVKYNKGVIEYAVNMSAKLIHERYLPDKAIDLIDEAGAYRKLHPVNQKRQSINKNVINEVLTKICRIPVETVNTQDVTELASLEERLKNIVFGQDEAISQVVNAVKFSKAGLSEENKPLASLLFVGPTGVGKTEIARSLAEELGTKLLRFDMSEYEEKHAVAKLIGAPAGYVGYDEGGLLTEAVRKNPSAVLLLDEIEKAHADIYNILLQVMDYATLTDNQGRKADFRNIILIMTSNAGASRLGKAGIGFERKSMNQSTITEEVNRVFQPEFRNRLNKIVVFNSMNEDMAKLIVNKKLNELGNSLLKKKIVFTADAAAKELVLKKGVSPEFGAREIDRIIRNEIKPLFVDQILFGKLKNGGKLTLTAEKDNFKTLTE